MSKVAPDTRNKIDSQKDLTPKKMNRKQRKASLKEIRSAMESSPVVLKLEKKLSKGQIFKQMHGISKTMKRNMAKHGLSIYNYSDSLNEYRAIVRKRKLAEKKARQEKHSVAVAKRKSGKRATKAATGKKAA